MGNYYCTDVLVIGTGGAGLRAAIEAEADNVKVLMVSKAPAGHNNCTIVAGSEYLAAIGGMSVDEHLERTMSTGKGLNDPKLVKVLTEEGGMRVLELEKFGCTINVKRGGINIGNKRTKLGQGITLPMVKYVQDRGIEIIENTIITRILMESKRVIGAVGYNASSKKPVIFSCKTLVLASGGAGALYKRTDCPTKTTGDGYSLAFQIGARLRDMEFVQFYPLALAEPGQPALLLNGPITEKSKIINTLGENIPEKHGVIKRPYIAKSRDLLSRAMMKEILAGSGTEDAVLLDGRDIIKQGHSGDNYGMGSHDFFIDQLSAHERPIRVAPLSHFSMGGVLANTFGETDVDAFFVVGEVMGGVHGANRHGGNSLTDITVFGARVGAKAAEYSKKLVLRDVEDLASLELDKYERISSRETGFLPSMVMNLLRETMWEKVGIVRDSSKLVEAYEKIQELRDAATKLQVFPGRQMMAALELPLALDTAEFIIRGAMERRESRGAHYRSDHPFEDPFWNKTVILCKKNNSVQVSTLKLSQAFD
jgi:succinate dehydrogenase/fumarate reductase flavoprotein subunit